MKIREMGKVKTTEERKGGMAQPRRDIRGHNDLPSAQLKGEPENADFQMAVVKAQEMLTKGREER